MGCAVKTASLSCAAKKASPRACITHGQKSLWKLVRGGLLVTQRVLPTLVKSRTYAVKRALKECVADLTLENRLLKKSMIGDGEDDA
jgi:hypothetical protein